MLTMELRYLEDFGYHLQKKILYNSEARDCSTWTPRIVPHLALHAGTGGINLGYPYTQWRTFDTYGGLQKIGRPNFDPQRAGSSYQEGGVWRPTGFAAAAIPEQFVLALGSAMLT